jgi:ribosomal protein L37AE/L43A
MASASRDSTGKDGAIVCPFCEAEGQTEQIYGKWLWFCSSCARTFGQPDLDRKNLDRKIDALKKKRREA